MTTQAPAFQFYPKDHLTDDRITAITLEEEAVFLRLLMHQWIVGSIPDDLGRLSHMTRVPRRRMAKVWAAVQDRFVPVEGKTGAFINRRLEKERQVQEVHRLRRSQDGRRAAEARWTQEAAADDAVEPDRAIPSEPPSTDPSRKRLVASAQPSQSHESNAAIVEIFDYWKTVMGVETASLGKTTRQRIRSRLQEGFTMADLKAAIDGCKVSAWHMGENADKKLFNDITIICRDDAQVRKLAALAKPVRRAPPVQDAIPYFMTPEFRAEEEIAVAERIRKKQEAMNA